jgi:hypothetical protein
MTTFVAPPETPCEQTRELPSLGELPPYLSAWEILARCGHTADAPASHHALEVPVFRSRHAKRRQFRLPRRFRFRLAALLMSVVIRGGAR